VTLQQAAQQALEVQNAVNLSGVVKSFDTILQTVLWPEARKAGEGTEWVNTHPISIAFVDKLASLTRTQYNSSPVFSAFDELEKLAKGQDGG